MYVYRNKLYCTTLTFFEGKYKGRSLELSNQPTMNEVPLEPRRRKQSSFRQPKATWAVAFACIVAFMGLGLVDPILTSIAKDLHATASQVELLFTSYMLITAVMMLITGAVSSRIGPKKTLLFGLFIIVIFAMLAGFSNTVNQIIWFRGGWGLGNALFIATALAVIVSVTIGGTATAVIIYEASIGLGLSVGPLLGGWLGGISWRGPFYGVSILMAIGFFAILFLLPTLPKPKRKSSILDPLRALRFPGLLSMAFTAFFYNYGFYTLFAFTPFILNMSARNLGYVFFGWGIAFAIFSVFVAPRVEKRFNLRRIMYLMLFLIALDLLVLGLTVAAGTPTVSVLGMNWSAQVIIVAAVIIAGIFMGINGTLVTTAVMEVAPVERSVASAAYSFVRFFGGAIAPYMSGKLAEWYNPSVSFYVGSIVTAVAIIALLCGRKYVGADHHEVHAKNEKTVMNNQVAVSLATVAHAEPLKPQPEVRNPVKNADFDFRKAILEIKQGTLHPKNNRVNEGNKMNDQEYRQALLTLMQSGKAAEVEEPMDDQVFRESLRKFRQKSNELL
jgi:MFS transporter, ACDE family, multidrug resistance protein